MLFCYQKRPLFELCETLAENKNIYCSQVALSLSRSSGGACYDCCFMCNITYTNTLCIYGYVCIGWTLIRRWKDDPRSNMGQRGHSISWLYSETLLQQPRLITHTHTHMHALRLPAAVCWHSVPFPFYSTLPVICSLGHRHNPDTHLFRVSVSRAVTHKDRA